MQVARHMLLPAAIAFAVSVPIAINHDEAYLEHERSQAADLGDFMREHVVGHMAIAGLAGASIAAGLLGRGNVAAVLGAGAAGVTLGTVAGHAGWDAYLARAEDPPGTTAG